MRQQVGRFHQQETVFRIGGEDSPSAILEDEVLVILFRIETQQREFEAVLPVRFAMTAAGIAAEFCEDRHDFVAKIHRNLFRTTLGRERHCCSLIPRCSCGNRDLTIQQWSDESTFVHRQDVRIVNGKSHLVCQIVLLSG